MDYESGNKLDPYLHHCKYSPVTMNVPKYEYLHFPELNDISHSILSSSFLELRCNSDK